MPQSPEQLLATHEQVKALVEDGRLDEAVQVCEQWVGAASDRSLPFEWLVQAMVRRDGEASALAAVAQNLARPDLSPSIRGCLSAILAMYRLPVLAYGAWESGSLAPQEVEVIGLVQTAEQLAPRDARWAQPALAVVRAYQARPHESRTLALRVLSRPQAPAAEQGWALACVGMCDAGVGDTASARARLEEVRALDPTNRFLPALEASLA